MSPLCRPQHYSRSEVAKLSGAEGKWSWNPEVITTCLSGRLSNGPHVELSAAASALEPQSCLSQTQSRMQDCKSEYVAGGGVKWAEDSGNNLLLRGVPIFHSVSVKNDRWDSFFTHVFFSSTKIHLSMCLMSNSLYSVTDGVTATSLPFHQFYAVSQQSSTVQRCFSHVAHPGSIEDCGGTLLNQPCNSSHKMKVMHHKQETNIWGMLHSKHEITET